MASNNLAEKIANEFDGSVINGDAHFNVDGSQFVFTDVTIYQSFDSELGRGCKKVRTLNAVKKFVSLRV